MKVAVIGGGPAGLYFALLMKKADPRHEVTVLERNRAGTHVRLGRRLLRPDARQLPRRRSRDASTRSPTTSPAGTTSTSTSSGRTITSGGHGFAGIARQKLLEILQRRAAELGVDLRFGMRGPRRSRPRRPRARRRRPGRRRRRRQQRRPPRSTPRTSEPDLDVRHGPLRLARHHAAVRRLHLRLRRERRTASSRPTPTASTTTLSAFIVECDEALLAQRRLRPHGHRRHDRRLRGDVRARGSTGTA